jgi:dTDP-4-dehydrorhamnose reductase
VTGTLHCVGAEPIHRVDLARRAVELLGLDAGLLAVGPPPAGARGPHDTSLDATYTAKALGVELRGVDSLLSELSIQLEETTCTT